MIKKQNSINLKGMIWSANSHHELLLVLGAATCALVMVAEKMTTK